MRNIVSLFLIVAKPQFKRKLVGFRVYNAPGSGELVIWEGYEKPKTDMFGDPETSETGMVVRQSRYSSCDPRYMIDAFNSVSKEPVFARLPEVDEEESSELPDDVYEFISRINNVCLARSGESRTLCGRPMLSNNYALESNKPYLVGERTECAACRAAVKEVG